MPRGKIAKIVHLSLQSAAAVEAGSAPKGYGYVEEPGGKRLYFDAKVVEPYSFDDLQVGQTVEFEPDAKLPVAKSVTPVPPILAPPVSQTTLP